MEGVEHVQTSHGDLNASVKAIYQSNCWVGFACDEEKEKQILLSVLRHANTQRTKIVFLLISVSTGICMIHSVMHISNLGSVYVLLIWLKVTSAPLNTVGIGFNIFWACIFYHDRILFFLYY